MRCSDNKEKVTYSSTPPPAYFFLPSTKQQKSAEQNHKPAPPMQPSTSPSICTSSIPAVAKATQRSCSEMLFSSLSAPFQLSHAGTSSQGEYNLGPSRETRDKDDLTVRTYRRWRVWSLVLVCTTPCGIQTVYPVCEVRGQDRTAENPRYSRRGTGRHMFQEGAGGLEDMQVSSHTGWVAVEAGSGEGKAAG